MKIVPEGWYGVTCVDNETKIIGSGRLVNQSLKLRIDGIGFFRGRNVFFNFFRAKKDDKDYQKIEDVRQGVLQTFSNMFDEVISCPSQIIGKSFCVKIKHARVPTLIENKKEFVDYAKVIDLKLKLVTLQ